MLVVFLNIFDLAVPIQVRKILYLYVFFRFLSLKRHLKSILGCKQASGFYRIVVSEF